MNQPLSPAKPSTVNFGPDSSDTPTKPPKVNVDKPPRSADSVLAKFGTNRKTRSNIRKLTRPANADEFDTDEDDSDYTKLVRRYRWLGKIAYPVRPQFGDAMQMQAEECADSWFQLAENNDKVRHWILAFIEGGDWGGVVAAHMPIFMAVIPEKTLHKLFMTGMGLFRRSVDEDEEANGTNGFGHFQ